MEKLQGPINPSFLEQESGAMSMLMSEFLTSFEEHQQDPYGLIPSLEDSNKMPFLQMLQGVESSQHNPPFFPLLHENNFQLLLRLQNQNPKPLDTCFELDSCITTINNNVSNNYMDMHSPAKSQISPTPGPGQPAESRAVVERSKRAGAAAATKEQRRKRKRSTRPSKNKEEVETQRMTHIAVERNRRRQMNEHLNALRSLMPPSYIQRGDQASIIGGAIDFVKELEQLLQSLQAQKRMRQSEETGDVSASSSTSSSSNLLSNLFMNPPSSSTTTSSSSPLTHQFRYSHEEVGNGEGGKGNEGEYSAENRSGVADIEVVVIQSHVNLKIHCQRRPGQLLKAIVALEQLRLSVLHLNITSFHNLVHYSFNLKIEEDCKLGSADEVATAVHQIFSLINIS